MHREIAIRARRGAGCVKVWSSFVCLLANLLSSGINRLACPSGTPRRPQVLEVGPQAENAGSLAALELGDLDRLCGKRPPASSMAARPFLRAPRCPGCWGDEVITPARRGRRIEALDALAGEDRQQAQAPVAHIRHYSASGPWSTSPRIQRGELFRSPLLWGVDPRLSSARARSVVRCCGVPCPPCCRSGLLLALWARDDQIDHRLVRRVRPHQEADLVLRHHGDGRGLW